MRTPPDLLPAIAVFIRVARHGSFTRASEELGVSPSALSQTLRMLETRLDVRLLDRTSRKVSVTEMGRRFLDATQAGIDAVERAVEELNESREKPAGLLRLNLSRTAADIVLLPHLTDFMAAYPEVHVEAHCDDAFTDLVGGGFDAGIRLGEFLSQTMIAVPVSAPMRIATFAAPAYLAGKAPPLHPEQLRQHRCLNIRFPGAGGTYRWEYAEQERSFEIDIGGDLVSNDGDVLLTNARAGAGISVAFEAMVRADFDAGRLVPLLERWWPTRGAFYLYYPSRLHMPRKLRVFIDFLRTRNGLGLPR